MKVQVVGPPHGGNPGIVPPWLRGDEIRVQGLAGGAPGALERVPGGGFQLAGHLGLEVHQLAGHGGDGPPRARVGYVDSKVAATEVDHGA